MANEKTEINDEIDSIMNEIEALQKEMSSDGSSETPIPAAVPQLNAAAPTQNATTSSAATVVSTPTADIVPESDTSVDDILSEIQAAAENSDNTPGNGLEDTLGDIKADVSAGGLLDDASTNEPTNESTSEREEIMPKTVHGSSAGNDGTLSLTLSGNMTLKLKYEFEGQEVTISFADQALRVQMTDGTEFKVPVARTVQSSNVKPIKKAV